MATANELPDDEYETTTQAERIAMFLFGVAMCLLLTNILLLVALLFALMAG